VERAVATMGEYRLSPEHSHLAVSTRKWFTLNEQQRQCCFNRFSKARICTDVSIQGIEGERLISEDNPMDNSEECMDDEQSTSTANPLHSLLLEDEPLSLLSCWSNHLIQAPVFGSEMYGSAPITGDIVRTALNIKVS